MVGVFREGFDTYATLTGTVVGMFTKWTADNGGGLVAGRFGGQALRSGNTGEGSTSGNFDSAISEGMICCGINMGGGLGGTAYSSLLFYSDTTTMFGIGFNADGSIAAYRQTAATSGATLLGTSAAGAVLYNTWHTLEMRFTVSDTTGSIVVKIDGVEKLNLTNVDNRNGTPTTVNRIRWQSSQGTVGNAIDDIYITDQNAFLTNPVRIETLRPDGDGATLNWIPSTGVNHYAVVDETLASTTDYLQANNVGDVDELTLGALSSTPTSIEEINVIMYASKTDVASRSLYPGVKSGATTSDGTAYALTSSGGRVERPLSTDPDTAAAWSASGVNALQVRPKVAS